MGQRERDVEPLLEIIMYTTRRGKKKTYRYVPTESPENFDTPILKAPNPTPPHSC